MAQARFEKALYRTLTTQLFQHEAITTTLAKAKRLRSHADKMITLAKKGDLPAYRRAAAYLTDESVVQKLFQDLGPRFLNRGGGYTRVLKIGHRKGDNAPIARIELVEGPKAGPKKGKKPIRLKAIERHAFYEKKLREHGHPLPESLQNWEWRVPSSWLEELDIYNPPSYVARPLEDVYPQLDKLETSTTSSTTVTDSSDGYIDITTTSIQEEVADLDQKEDPSTK